MVPAPKPPNMMGSAHPACLAIEHVDADDNWANFSEVNQLMVELYHKRRTNEK